jgi:hypothetical protein
MFLGLPLSPSLGNPNLGKNNKVGHLGSQIKQKNVTAPHENNHPIKFLYGITNKALWKTAKKELVAIGHVAIPFLLGTTDRGNAACHRRIF